MTPGEAAEELIALIESDLSALGEFGRRIVMGKLDRFCEGHEDAPMRKIKKATARPPFTEAEARAFENQLLPDKFKRFAGFRVIDVVIADRGYLTHLTDPDDFITELVRYVTSERGKRRIEQGD